VNMEKSSTNIELVEGGDDVLPTTTVSFNDQATQPNCKSCRYKKLMLVASLLVATAIVIATSLDIRYSKGGISSSSSSAGSISAATSEDTESIVSASPPFNTLPWGESIANTTFTGNTSGFIIAKPDYFSSRQSLSSSCPTGQGLWNLKLTTDWYAFETKWSLHKYNNDERIAYGPPESYNYEDTTTYTGNLCLPIGQYYIRWYDLSSDGVCCTYGEGSWIVKVNGKVVLKNNPNDDSFQQRDFPFEVVSSTSGDDVITGMFLRRTLFENIQTADGRIYELINLPPNFDYTQMGLISGETYISLPPGTVLLSDQTIDMKGKIPSIVQSNMRRDGRKLANFLGKQTILGVRVIAKDSSTTSNETVLGNSIFGSNNPDSVLSLATQIKACSNDKMNIIKAIDRSGTSQNSGDVSILNGMITVRIPFVSTTQGDAIMRNAISMEVNEIFDVNSPGELADYIIYCLPPGTFKKGKIAYAYMNSWLSVFNDEWCTSASLLMHELGHSMNFGHSNGGQEPGPSGYQLGAYGDESGKMGYAYPNKKGPRSCFNAAKSYQAGWYKDKSVTINSSGKTPCFDGVLYGIADYPIANAVLFKVQTTDSDYYINYNAKKGINQGTQEAGNMVTVVSRPRGPRDSYAESDLVAKLETGEAYSFSDYTVSVGKIDIGKGIAEVTVLPAGQNSCNIKN